MADRERYTFKKEERITGKTRIENIFASGDSFLIYPFRVVYRKEINNLSTTHSLLISVPKKRLKRAVDRNRIKRRAREAYRLNKKLIELEPLKLGQHLDIAIIYVADTVLPFKNVEKSIKRVLCEINKKLNKHSNKT